MRLVDAELRQRPYDYERAIAEVPPTDRKYGMAVASPFFFLDRVRLAEIAIGQRMALMGNLRESVIAGSLLSYGPSLTEMWGLAANYVDRIAKGGKPADLAIQQPTKFELVLNLNTAKAIGIDVSPALLARADEVIE
jgi:putative ABC transport system substrate-binding protein